MTPKRRSKLLPKIKPSLIAVYAGVFAVIVALVYVGYTGPQSSSATSSDSNKTSLNNQVDKTSVDNVIATNVAAEVASTANLPIATSVANLAASAQIKSEFMQSNGASSAKPQIVASTQENRLVTSYTVVAGDTVGSLATKFNVTTQTIKWANNLTTDALAVGKVLRILPIDGVLYDVKSGDTIDSIATKYSVDKDRLATYNDLELSGLVSNTKIILPSANLPETERPGYVAPVVINYFSGYGTGFGGNTWNIGYGTPDNGLYAHGNCTLYAYNRRKALGLPVGDHWYNASSWAYMAALPVSQGGGGLLVDHTPSVGAIMQNGGYLGHVAIVESILSNGDLSISEMNAYVSGGGYNIVSGRIVPAGNVGQYLYIH